MAAVKGVFHKRSLHSTANFFPSNYHTNEMHKKHSENNDSHRRIENSLNGWINGKRKRTEQIFWNPVIFVGGYKDEWRISLLYSTGPWRRHLEYVRAWWNCEHKFQVLKRAKNYGTICQTAVATWAVVELCVIAFVCSLQGIQSWGKA